MSSPSHETIRGARLVLNFHGIGDIPAHAGAAERPYWSTHRDFLALLDAIDSTSVSEGLKIQITFDDGNESDVNWALPALLERGLVADFFVCAGRLGHPGYLDEAQIRQLRDAGMGVGSHGWGHVDWRTADDATLDRELRVARERLSDVLDRTVSDVAVPFGSYDRRVIRAIRHSGYRTVYTSDRGRARDGWIVPRETWRAGWGLEWLREVAGDRPLVRHRVSRSLILLAKRLR